MKTFLRDESGAETVEQAIFAGLVIAGAIAVIAVIGNYVYRWWNDLESNLNGQ